MSKVVVTGGGGFLGRALCLSLLEESHDVYSVARGHYPELESLGVTTVRADISESTPELASALSGASVVFHTAAKVAMWGHYEDFYRVNVVGTRNIIELCRKEQVPVLVYTSSPSVVADGTNLEGIDESYPYPKEFKAYYPKTKSIAEAEVLAASGESLKTISLRPHLIWGPGDTNLVPTILERAKAGRLPQVGSGENLVDVCYIEDCVSAHKLAWQAAIESPEAVGKAYFISQGTPVKMWEWIADILRRNDLPPIKKKISYRTAYSVATLLEMLSRIRPGYPEPMLTRFLVSEMATSHYFDISRAKKLLGFRPRFSIQEGMDRTF